MTTQTLPSAEQAAQSDLLPKRRVGRPTKAEALLKAAQSLKHGPRSKKGRPLGGRVALDTSDAEVARWASGHGLRDAARRVIGLALQTIDAVLRGGRIVNGVRPEVALAHAMSSPLLKVAGYDDKAPAVPQVTLVQVAIGQPGAGNGMSSQVLEAVRVEHPQIEAKVPND